MDIVANVLTKVVELYTSLLSKMDKHSKSDSKSLAKIEAVLGDMKEQVSKLGSFHNLLFHLIRCPPCFHLLKLRSKLKLLRC